MDWLASVEAAAEIDTTDADNYFHLALIAAAAAVGGADAVVGDRRPSSDVALSHLNHYSSTVVHCSSPIHRNCPHLPRFQSGKQAQKPAQISHTANGPKSAIPFFVRNSTQKATIPTHDGRGGTYNWPDVRNGNGPQKEEHPNTF